MPGERSSAAAAAAGRGRDAVALEAIGRYEQALKRTARRYSLCEADAEDAYQQALETFLTKPPTGTDRKLIAWMHVVIKNAAIDVRRRRRRSLGSAPPATEGEGRQRNWEDLIPSENDGPAEKAERSESMPRNREALLALKPQELRALILLGEGYSYAEIGKLTGWSYTKINRCLAEGRQRFRDLVARSEDGRRCQEMESLLSAFCDGEIEPQDSAALRGHLSACASCRATLRAYRAAGPAAAALGPVLPLSRTLAERAQELFAGLQARLPGGSGATEITMTQIASGGGRGTGAATIAKVLAICVGTAGGATCVATGVVPLPLAAERPEKVSSQRQPAPPTAAETEPRAGEGTYTDAQAPPPEEAASEQPREQGAGKSEDRAGTGAGSTTAKRSSPPPPPATEFTPEIATPPPEYGGTEAGGGGSDGGDRDGPAGPGPAATNRANAAEFGP